MGCCHSREEGDAEQFGDGAANETPVLVRVKTQQHPADPTSGGDLVVELAHTSGIDGPAPPSVPVPAPHSSGSPPSSHSRVVQAWGPVDAHAAATATASSSKPSAHDSPVSTASALRRAQDENAQLRSQLLASRRLQQSSQQVEKQPQAATAAATDARVAELEGEKNALTLQLAAAAAATAASVNALEAELTQCRSAHEVELAGVRAASQLLHTQLHRSERLLDETTERAESLRTQLSSATQWAERATQENAVSMGFAAELRQHMATMEVAHAEQLTQAQQRVSEEQERNEQLRQRIAEEQRASAAKDHTIAALQRQLDAARSLPVPSSVAIPSNRPVSAAVASSAPSSARHGTPAASVGQSSAAAGAVDNDEEEEEGGGGGVGEDSMVGMEEFERWMAHKQEQSRQQRGEQRHVNTDDTTVATSAARAAAGVAVPPIALAAAVPPAPATADPSAAAAAPPPSTARGRAEVFPTVEAEQEFDSWLREQQRIKEEEEGARMSQRVHVAAAAGVSTPAAPVPFSGDSSLAGSYTESQEGEAEFNAWLSREKRAATAAAATATTTATTAHEQPQPQQQQQQPPPRQVQPSSSWPSFDAPLSPTAAAASTTAAATAAPPSQPPPPRSKGAWAASTLSPQELDEAVRSSQQQQRPRVRVPPPGAGRPTRVAQVDPGTGGERRAQSARGAAGATKALPSWASTTAATADGDVPLNPA